MCTQKTVYIQSASDYDPNRFGRFYSFIRNNHQARFLDVRGTHGEYRVTKYDNCGEPGDTLALRPNGSFARALVARAV